MFDVSYTLKMSLLCAKDIKPGDATWADGQCLSSSTQVLINAAYALAHWLNGMD